MRVNDGFSFRRQNNIRKTAGQAFQSFVKWLLWFFIGVDAVDILRAIDGAQKALKETFKNSAEMEKMREELTSTSPAFS